MGSNPYVGTKVTYWQPRRPNTAYQRRARKATVLDENEDGTLKLQVLNPANGKHFFVNVDGEPTGPGVEGGWTPVASA